MTIIIIRKERHKSASAVSTLIKVNYISLVNLIAEEEVVKELIQGQMNEIEVKKELQKLLFNEEETKEIIKGYEKIKAILGNKNASATAAELIINYLKA